MKAIICSEYGPPEVLELKEIEKPVPMDNEILIKIHATTVASGDIRVRSFNSPLLLWIPMRLVLGLRKPRKSILGVELAGVIEEVGKNVEKFKKGDRIFAMTGMNFGAYAEYICLPAEGNVVIKPDNLSCEEAAAISFGGTSALHFLRKGNIQEGQRVLIYGASGSVGTSAIQIANSFGAEVTAVCSSSNIEWVRSLGAHRVIDYIKEDFTKREERYDLIFDAVGKCPKKEVSKALTANGKFMSVEGQGIAKVLKEDLLFLSGLVEKKLFRPVIDKCYPLEQIQEAHRYVEQGHKKGNVIITINQK